MHPDELIMISVDDHVVEPPTLFDGRLPAKYQRSRSPRRTPAETGATFGCSTGNTPNIGLNAVAGRPEGRVRDRTDRLRGDATRHAYDIHERIKRHECRWCPGLDVLPVVPRIQRPALRPGTDKGLGPRPCCGPTTTGTSTSGAAPTPAGSSPWPYRPCGTPSHGRRGPAGGGQGVPRRDVLREPREAQASQLPQRPWDPFWTALSDEQDDGVPAHRLVVVAGRHRTRCPHRRPDHLAARQHRPGGRRSAVVAGAQEVPGTPGRPVGGRDRLDPVLPRPHGLGLRAHHGWTGQDFGNKLPSQVFPEQVVTCFIDDPARGRNAPPRRDRHHVLGADYPHSDSTWPSHRKSS